MTTLDGAAVRPSGPPGAPLPPDAKQPDEGEDGGHPADDRADPVRVPRDGRASARSSRTADAAAALGVGALRRHAAPAAATTPSGAPAPARIAAASGWRPEVETSRIS